MKKATYIGSAEGETGFPRITDAEEIARLADEVVKAMQTLHEHGPITGGFIGCTCCPLHGATPPKQDGSGGSP